LFRSLPPRNQGDFLGEFTLQLAPRVGFELGILGGGGLQGGIVLRQILGAEDVAPFHAALLTHAQHRPGQHGIEQPLPLAAGEIGVQRLDFFPGVAGRGGVDRGAAEARPRHRRALAQGGGLALLLRRLGGQEIHVKLDDGVHPLLEADGGHQPVGRLASRGLRLALNREAQQEKKKDEARTGKAAHRRILTNSSIHSDTRIVAKACQPVLCLGLVDCLFDPLPADTLDLAPLRQNGARYWVPNPSYPPFTDHNILIFRQVFRGGEETDRCVFSGISPRLARMPMRVSNGRPPAVKSAIPTAARSSSWTSWRCPPPGRRSPPTCWRRSISAVPASRSP